MKLITLTILLATLASQAHAGVKECTATNSSSGEAIPFTMDWEHDGTTLVFEKPIAWNPNALKFEIVHSSQTDAIHLVVATAQASPSNQVVEIRFDRTFGWMQKGVLTAGDLDSTMRNMGKFQEYQVTCN